MQRILSIDILRATAIILMIFCHFSVYLAPSNVDQGLYFLANHILGDWPAPFFLFLVGLSQVISGSRKKSADQDKAPFDWRPFKRGGFILLAGILLGVALKPSGRPIFAWDVLLLIGVSVMILAFCKRLSSPVLLGACVAIFLAAPHLRGWADYASWWGGQAVPEPVLAGVFPGILSDPAGDYEGGSSLGQVLLGLLVVGEFPLFPWLIFPLAGMLVGRRLIQDLSDRTFVPRLLGLGLLLASIGIGCAYGAMTNQRFDTVSSFVAPLSFYPLSPSLLLFQLGGTFMVFGLLRWIFDGENTSTVFSRFCERFSRYSLTIYIVHYLIMFWSVFLADFLLHPPETHFKRLIISRYAFLFAGALTVFFGFLLERWDRINGRFSLEWCLVQVTQPGAATKPAPEPQKTTS